MTAFVTPKDAGHNLLCPVARTFGAAAKKGDHCMGPACALWRWKPRLASDPEFLPAVKREMMNLAAEENAVTGKNKPHTAFHTEAAKRVARNPEGFGIEQEVGFCGLGGLPT